MLRNVSRIVPGYETYEGEGFLVHRPFPTRALMDFDPFLLLDEMGPMDLAPGEAKGAPDHPHRGFETVTYLLSGSFQHEDSAGHAGKLHPGDVQWMTAGSGLVHSEMPDEDFIRKGGRLHGLQLWVNLPKRDKMMAPRYQEIAAANIPTAESDGGKVKVRVIAGEAMGQTAAIDTRTPILYLHYHLTPRASTVQKIPGDFNVFAYVLEGEAVFEKQRVAANHMAIFAKDGDEVELQASATQALDVLLIGGLPIKEPIERYGPFVMNTKEEIRQAVEDYQSGRMGTIRR